MDISMILVIVVLVVYLVWKLMGTANKKKPASRRFNIGKHRRKKIDDDDDGE